MHLLFHFQGIHLRNEVTGDITFPPCGERFCQPPVTVAVNQGGSTVTMRFNEDPDYG